MTTLFDYLDFFDLHFPDYTCGVFDDRSRESVLINDDIRMFPVSSFTVFNNLKHIHILIEVEPPWRF